MGMIKVNTKAAECCNVQAYYGGQGK